jgi:DNA segregation ATPase FtsK/SpoIIIE-like protein
LVLIGERHDLPPMLAELDERRARRTALIGAGTFAALLVAFWAWWPAGVALGLVVGVLAVLHVGGAMHHEALTEPTAGFAALTAEEDLGQEFRRLRVRLGDDWPAFSRAAVLVTQAQWASLAGLQRELHITVDEAQHLMGQLEREGFVGPSRGARPRVVRLSRDCVPELDRLMPR